ncbi:MAG: 50S ribosomal protein L11 methyltransferase [Bacteroidales bacterium]|jgi:ribosomal protein L11 methyltransferase|nr:50S ribosomal protein L11 methyltransferase [Bacteroidales bacterium]
MDYKKAIINFTPCEEWLRDILIAQLGEIGYDSFLETETGFEAYIPENQFNSKSVDDIIQAFSEIFTFEISFEKTKSKNWNEEWEKNYFKPLVVGAECVVRAPFHTDFPKAKYEIVIEPNMAFGTGNHETTLMMLEYIIEENMEGKNILDMGCGTGILGILTSMKGAAKITAIDIDEWAFEGAKGNMVLNNIGNIEVKLGDVSLLGNEKFDIILANIQRNVLLADLPAYSKCLKKDGKIFLSGFFTEDIHAIKTKAEETGLKNAFFKTKNNWVAHAFVKSDE